MLPQGSLPPCSILVCLHRIGCTVLPVLGIFPVQPSFLLVLLLMSVLGAIRRWESSERHEARNNLFTWDHAPKTR